MPRKDPEALKAYKKEWYERNKDRLLKKAKEYREARKEEIAEYKRAWHAERMKDPEYVEQRKLYGKKRRADNYDHVKAIEKRSYRKHRDRWAERQTAKYNDIETKARNAVNAAVKAGKIPRVSELECRDCGSQAENYHHESYTKDKWLDVVPLCVMCHKAVHANDS